MKADVTESRQLEDRIDVPDQASNESKPDDPPTDPVHGFPKPERDEKHEENQESTSTQLPFQRRGIALAK